MPGVSTTLEEGDFDVVPYLLVVLHDIMLVEFNIIYMIVSVIVDYCGALPVHHKLLVLSL